MIGLIVLVLLCAAILGIGLSLSSQKGDAITFILLSSAMTLGAVALYDDTRMHEKSYNQGVLDHAAGLVQVDSTWESRITIKEVGK